MNWYDVCDKWSSEGYDSLSAPQQVWVNTRGFIDAVDNGGLVSFFYNSQADRYEDTVFALADLEAAEALDVLETFGAFFGDEVPDDMVERNEIINSWASDSPQSRACESVDTILRPYIEPLEQKLEAYVIEQGFDPEY
ncbi:DMP19 family protein [Posidoniimonas corsicana]|nr:DUF4375 domain-containing protein [Posidoniimonas corsicana]